MYLILSLLTLLALLTPPTPTPIAEPTAAPLVTITGPTRLLLAGDVWTVTATLTAPAAARYELGIVPDTRLAEAGLASTSGPADCPESLYCVIDMQAGEVFTLTAILAAPPIALRDPSYRAVVWGGAWEGDVHVSGAASVEAPVAYGVALPLLQEP